MQTRLEIGALNWQLYIVFDGGRVSAIGVRLEDNIVGQAYLLREADGKFEGHRLSSENRFLQTKCVWVGMPNPHAGGDGLAFNALQLAEGGKRALNDLTLFSLSLDRRPQSVGASEGIA